MIPYLRQHPGAGCAYSRIIFTANHIHHELMKVNLGDGHGGYICDLGVFTNTRLTTVIRRIYLEIDIPTSYGRRQRKFSSRTGRIQPELKR